MATVVAANIATTAQAPRLFTQGQPREVAKGNRSSVGQTQGFNGGGDRRILLQPNFLFFCHATINTLGPVQVLPNLRGRH